MSIKVATNWFDKKLSKTLTRYDIDLVPIKNIIDVDPRDFDLVYYARFVPPLVDWNIFRPDIFSNMIYGLHSPMIIENPIRFYHYVYNMLIPSQIYILAKRGSIMHALNLDDYMLLKRFTHRIVYMPLGVDTEIFKCNTNKYKSDTFTLIYGSRPSWNKGTDLLVNIIIPVILKKLGQNIRIVIADASSGHLSYLYNKIKGISQVEIYDHLPSEKYAKLVSEAHILLFPSRYESFARVILEALACGVIPVAFNVRGVIRDIVMKTRLRQYVVNYPDLETFIKKIIELYKLWSNSPEGFQKLQIQACNIGRLYSWNNISIIWAKVFKRLALQNAQ
jgi:glycosyltransferase involved in cell wall biosynthesis